MNLKFLGPFLLSLICIINLAEAQETGQNSGDPKINWNAYLDVFYAYDFNKPVTNFRQPFIYHHNRQNEFNINLGLIQANIIQEKYHAYLGFQVGTYAADNYVAEEQVMQHIYEAYIGISLNESNNLWLDAGLFASHLGFESAISMDNWTLTRSLAAENSPYFLTGAKLTYTPTESWTFGFTIANGWQRIRRLPGNSLPCFGTQLTYSNESFTLNWSSLVGTDDPDDSRRVRVFNNFYGIFELSERSRLIAGFDIGGQQARPGSSTYDYWWVPTAILQYDLTDQLSSSLRLEYFDDQEEIIITSDDPLNGFSTSAFSLNLDYKPSSLVACRVEGRLFSSQYEQYVKNSGLSNNNLALIASMAVCFR